MKAFLKGLPPVETAVVIVAMLVLVGLGVLRQGGEKPATLNSFSTYDAGSGGYRAWFELMQRENVAVERFEQRPAFLDRAQFATLVWAEPIAYDPNQTFNTKADVSALEDWVRAGRRLVYLGSDDNAARRHVLGLPLSKKAGKNPGSVIASAWLRSAGVTLRPWPAPLRWQTPKHATVLIADRAGPLAVRYAFGRGEVVAIVDETPFLNAHLGEGDNARLAYALARPATSDAAVAFDEAVHNHLVPEHWWQLVPRPFLFAVALGALALAVAFTGSAIRLGPPSIPPERDPTSREFIDSFAALLERGRAARKALDDAAESTTRILTAALGLPRDAPAAAISMRIDDSALRGDYAALVQIVDDPRPDAPALVRGVALAQHLRKEFESHARSRN